MSDTDRVQRWRQRLREEGKEPMTVWLSHEDKLRLEGLARTLRCSHSEVLHQALAAYTPGAAPVTATITDTAQIRLLMQEELARIQDTVTGSVTEIVTATLLTRLPGVVRDMLRELRVPDAGAETIPGIAPVTDTGTDTVTETPQPRTPTLKKVALLAMVKEWQAERYSLKQIADRLNREGVLPLRGTGPWKKHSVDNLLRERSTKRQATPA